VAVAKDPSGPWAAAGLYQMGGLYADLYRYSHNNDDLREAGKLYQRIIREYPQSGYRDRAVKDLAALPVKASEPLSLGDVKLKDDIQSVIGDVGIGKTTAKAAPETAGSGVELGTPASSLPQGANNCGLTTVTGIRYWSNPDYTRVVIDADRSTAFQNNLLKKDPSTEKAHQRLYVDLKNSRLGNIEKTIPINDSLLQAARAGQYTADTVRVVIDINSFEDYNIFSLPNPFRIVIDVRGKPSPEPAVPGETIQQPNAASIARQLALGVRRIVIDPGHGGKDYGAPGYVKGVHEKHVVLDISKKLAGKIRKELGCEVVFTREKDEYITLEERTAIANMKKGDLFISIHANASRNQRAFGIETYFLNLTADDESITVAARENATSEKNISELQTILNDLLQNAKINESSRLATYVQKSLCKKMESKYNRINNKGVKQAPFYVLIGAQMPAILIETSFISNKTECQRLTDPAYQNTLCDGIVAGIRQYIKETQPTAYFGAPDNGSGG
jgi:N-acetylmuramoyl-L-alanine amidase